MLVMQQRLATVGQEMAAASRQPLPGVAALMGHSTSSKDNPLPLPHREEDIVLASVAAATGPTLLTASTAGFVQVGQMTSTSLFLV
jgi:hypothetical protein